MINKRWDAVLGDYIKNKDIDEFLVEIQGVCKKHNFSISHEDLNNSFYIQEYSEFSMGWLMSAEINIYEKSMEKKK